MTERITDEHELMMCPLRDESICTKGGIEVDYHECGQNFNTTYRACALWHDGRCDISRIAVHMSLLPTIAALLAGDINMDGMCAAAKRTKDRFDGKEES